MRKAEEKQEDKQIIEIKEDVKINEDTILEAGDKIEVFKESTDFMFNYADDMVMDIFAGDYESAFKEVIMGMSDREVKDAVDYIYRMYS